MAYFVFFFLDYVEELYHFYQKSSKEDLASAVDELKEMTPHCLTNNLRKLLYKSEVKGREWSQRRSLLQ